jgi:hypothetical protein
MLLSIVIDVRQYIDKNGKNIRKMVPQPEREGCGEGDNGFGKDAKEISRTSRPSVMESRDTGETAINGHRLRQGKVRRI